MFNWNEAIEIALRTWYPKLHNLHLNPHHPLGKLCGEWGELLDDYMKSIYKPNYKFEPEDELGDIWYYIRILCYQKDYDAVDFDLFERSTEYLIACAINETSRAFMDLITRLDYSYSVYSLDISYSVLCAIVNRHGLTLHDLTKSNWQKLKPGSERGEQWRKARLIA